MNFKCRFKDIIYLRSCLWVELDGGYGGVLGTGKEKGKGAGRVLSGLLLYKMECSV